MRPVSIASAGIVLVLLGASACAVRNPRLVAANVPKDRPPDITVSVVAKKFELDPSELRVRRGQLVELHLTATDRTHGFELQPFGIRAELAQDNPVIIQFLADRSGEFGFRCTIFCGVGHLGMRGKLIVE